MGSTVKEETKGTLVQGRFPAAQPQAQHAEKYRGHPAKILEDLTEAIPLLRENALEGERKGKPRLEEKDFAALANRSEKEIVDSLVEFIGAYKYTSDESFKDSRDTLVDNAAAIFSHDTWKIYQLNECVAMFDSDEVLEAFLLQFIPNMHRNIYWMPFLNKLLEVENMDALKSLLYGNEMGQYIVSWSESVVMFEEAEYAYGLSRIPNLETGLDLHVEVGEDEGYCTDPSGKIAMPPFEHTFETREENSECYFVTLFHELGHHKWGTFRVNMDPRVFDYEAFGVRHVSHNRIYDGALEVVVAKIGGPEEGKKDDKPIVITRFDDIIELVKYPALLHFLHNVIDDGRIDANNIMEYPGLAGRYRRNTESLLAKRPKLEDPNLQTLLEAILQYAIVGKTTTKIPPGIEQRFLEAKHFIDRVECGPETDGTASLNSAMRIYLLLEHAVEEEIKKMKENDVPKPMRNSKTKVGEGNASPQLTQKKPKRGRRGRPGVNPLQFANPEEGEEEGEQSGKPGKPKPGRGKPGSKTGEDEDESGGKPGKKQSGTQAGDETEGENDEQPKPGTRGNMPKPTEDEGEGEPEGKPKNGNKNGTPGQGKKIFIYNGFNGEKFTRNEHVIEEIQADGEVVVPEQQDAIRVVRIFKRYAPKRGELVRGVEDGDVDAELLEEYLRELECGRVPERAFYSRVLYEERDVGFGGLVDLSGSTSQVRGAIIKAMNTLNTASETCNDPFIVGGFTTGREDSTEVYVAMKEAHEHGIRNSDLCGGTPIGGPIRHMCHKMKEGMRNKGNLHMFVITDGDANVCRAPRPLGKESNGNGVNIPVVDAAMAVDEAWKKHRIRTSGIGIIYDESGRETMAGFLREIFGIGNYLIVTDKQVYAGSLDRYFEGFYRKTANKLR